MIFEKRDPFAEARWVGGTPAAVSPVILRRVDVKDVQNATLFVTGLDFLRLK